MENIINELIEEAKLEYFSDIEFNYSASKNNYSIDFYKDENGQNHINDFGKMVKGVWFQMTPTDKQIKMMWNKLDNTPYREVEPEFECDSWGEDNYEKYGVSRANFY